MGLFATLRHLKRLQAVEERLSTLESGYQQLELEWTNTFDKIRRAMAKLAKRAEAIEQVEESTPGSRGAPNGDVQSAALGLTGNQAQAQREILARRRGLGG